MAFDERERERNWEDHCEDSFPFWVKMRTIGRKWARFYVSLIISTLKDSISKVSFFWNHNQDMSWSGFPPKKQALIGRLIWSTNQRAVFWQETTWTHALSQISEKFDVNISLWNFQFNFTEKWLSQFAFDLKKISVVCAEAWY